MRKPNRKPATFTVDPDLLQFIRRSRGKRSASERLNEIVRQQKLLEEEQQLAREAEAFFATETEADRKETRAFQKAYRRVVARD